MALKVTQPWLSHALIAALHTGNCDRLSRAQTENFAVKKWGGALALLLVFRNPTPKLLSVSAELFVY